MGYAWDIEVKKDKTEASPKEQKLTIHVGVITRMEVKFPAGCHGLVKVRLLHYRAQLLPLNRGSWITGNGESVSFPFFYEIEKLPAFLNFVGWCDGCKYDHTVTVRVTVLPKAVATFMPLVDVMTRFLHRIGVI